MRDLVRQFLRHGVVGSVAFLVDFSVMVLLHETLGMDPLVASIISFTISVIVSYWGSMKWVFARRDDMSRRKEFAIYMVLSFIGLVLNSICMWIGQQLLLMRGIDWAHSNLYMVVKVLATFIVTFYNFFSCRRWLDAGNPNAPGSSDQMW